MAGNTGRFVKRLEARMAAAAAALDYEQAARMRDDIGALTKALEKSAVVLADATDADVFALADDELEAAHRQQGRRRRHRWHRPAPRPTSRAPWSAPRYR